MPRHNPRDDIVLQRLARYSEWVPYNYAMKTTNSIPHQAMLMMSSEKVMPIMSLAGWEGRSKVAPVKGAPGLTITPAECPPGDSAGLHKHTASVVNFFCVQSRVQNHLGGRGAVLGCPGTAGFCIGARGGVS